MIIHKYVICFLWVHSKTITMFIQHFMRIDILKFRRTWKIINQPKSSMNTWSMTMNEQFSHTDEHNNYFEYVFQVRHFPLSIEKHLDKVLDNERWHPFPPKISIEFFSKFASFVVHVLWSWYWQFDHHEGFLPNFLICILFHVMFYNAHEHHNNHKVIEF